MSRIDEQLAEDRALRDSALRLFKSDIGCVKTDMEGRNIALRLVDRFGEGTVDMFDDAADYAGANRGKVAAGLFAIGLLLARRPILKGLTQLLTDEEAETDDIGDPEPAEGDDAAEPEHPDDSSDQQRQFSAERIDE